MMFRLPEKRLKPKLLREIKSEALLVFCNTLLTLTSDKIEADSIFYDNRFKKEADQIKISIETLRKELNQSIINEEYFTYLMENKNKKKIYPIFLKELPLIYYTETLHNTLYKKMQEKQKWIPEFLIFALISQWFIEENNSTKLFNFIELFECNDILSTYERVSIKSDNAINQTINDMYKLSLELTSSLKKAKFKNYTKSKR